MTASRSAWVATLVLGLGLSATASQAAPYQKYLNGTRPNPICNIDFPVVPAGKTLTITNVSCYIRQTNAADFYASQLLVIGTGGGITHAVTLNNNRTEFISGSNEEVRQSNDQILAFARAGQRFRAYVERRNGAFSQVACHISGELTP